MDDAAAFVSIVIMSGNCVLSSPIADVFPCVWLAGGAGLLGVKAQQNCLLPVLASTIRCSKIVSRNPSTGLKHVLQLFDRLHICKGSAAHSLAGSFVSCSLFNRSHATAPTSRSKHQPSS